MAKRTIPKTSDRHVTERELYLKRLTAFLREAGKQPVAEFIDSLLAGEDLGPVGCLAWDERTEELDNEFHSILKSVGELLKATPVPFRGVSDELAEQVRRRLLDLEGAHVGSVTHVAEMMLNSTAEFFISVRVVPFLKELTALLEERGGAR